MEQAIQQLRGSVMIVEGQLQQLAEGGANELMRTIVAFRAELDSRATARARADEELKNELRGLVIKVHEKFVDLENTIALMKRIDDTHTTTMTAGSGTTSQQDPWAAAAAARPPPPAGAGNYVPTPPGMGDTTRKYKVEPRNWGDHRRLDLDIQPESFVAWRDRALGFLSADRPDVRRLLLWAEKQAPTIGSAEEHKGAAEVNLRDDVEHVSYVIFEAVKMIMSDSLLSRARACGDGRGLELWRKLHAEWRGSAPQVVAAKARRFQDPQRCATIQQLWEALPIWEQLGSEVLMGGYPIPDWVRGQALEKLVPENLLQTIVGRPELADYSAKLLWVKTQMEHARGATQAQHIGSATAMKKDMDVHMGALAVEKQTSDAADQQASGRDPLLWSLQAEAAKCAAAGDWDGAGAISGAIFALSKGKGKGKGKSGGKGPSWPTAAGYKGGGKGGGKSFDQGNKGGGKGNDFFDGYCHHCNGYGHRKSQCKTLDREMASKGGKGKSKGKGLYYTGNEEEDNENCTTTAGGSEQEPSDDQWWVGAVCSLTHEVAAERVKNRHLAPLWLKNSFEALRNEMHDDDNDDGYGMIPAVPEAIWPKPSAAAMEKRCSKILKSVSLRKCRQLDLLTKETDKAVCAVAKDQKKGSRYRLVEAVVDSGAEESVAPPKLFPGEVKPSPMSRAGGKYRAANGARIPNLGQQKVLFKNDEGQQCGTSFQIADVERPLISASQLAASGNSVVIDKKGGKIVNEKTGKIMQLQKRGGVYVLRMWIASETPGFPGQGK
jgi:hypothetical protein